MRSDSNLSQRFAAEGVDTRAYGSMPGVLDTNTEIAGRGRVLRSHSFSGHETNTLFMNSAGKRFRDVSGVSGADSIADGRGFAVLDYDRDGRRDVALVNTNEPQLELFRNQIGGNAAPRRDVTVRLVGGAGSPRDGFGAHVVVEAGPLSQRRELRCGDGFAVQNSADLAFGLGDAARADSIRVLWPSGKVSEAGDIAAGATVTLHEDGTAPAIEMRPVADISAAVARAESAALKAELGRLALDTGETRPPLRIVTTMATWCAVCRSEIPHLQRLRDMLPESDAAFFGFPAADDDTPEMLSQFAAGSSLPYQILDRLDSADRAAVTAYLADRLGEVALPATIVLDPGNRVLSVRKGVPTLSRLRLLLMDARR